MTTKPRILFAVVIQAVFIFLSSCGHAPNADVEQIDSLNILAYQMKYRSMDSAMTITNDLLYKYKDSPYKDGLHEALLNKGDLYELRMEFDSAQMLYNHVLKESNNDLLCSMADVNMMSICLKLSMSKEFYDYRTDAQERMSVVSEEMEDMTDHQTSLWKGVQTDFHHASLNYFIKMRQDDPAKEEIKWLTDNQELFENDTIRFSSFLYLKSICSVFDEDSVNAADERQSNLIRLLSLSKQSGYTYYQVLASNGLARSILYGAPLRPSRMVFIDELIGEFSFAPLDIRLAHRALSLAESFGNDYVHTSALVTLSDCFLRQGKDSMALQQMDRALALINKHHQKMSRNGRYGADRGKDMLYAYAPMTDSLSTEMRWILDPHVVAVPEWMAMVREQLSVIYGAMGMKTESDYNHNIYFDILDATRQDLRALQEEDNLKGEENMLNLLLWSFIIVFIVLGWLLYLYNKRSHFEYHKKVKMLSRVIDICKNMSSALNEEIEDVDDLDVALHHIVDSDVEKLFPQLKGKDWTKTDIHSMKGLDAELFHVLLVFYDWMKQKGLQYIQFTEERERLESETYLFEKRLEDNKRQYIEKLTSMSIVNGITPFLDRALHEINRLKSDKDATPEIVRDRFIYLSELIDMINDYNDVLGHWVKIRQGMVSLNIENFALKPLFETLRRGSKSFDIKGVSLTVDDTDCVVKADKSLTLFMMNTLLDNARKYTPEGGQVMLMAKEAEQYVEISVKDTGLGMSAEDTDTLNNSKVYDSSKIGTKGNDASDIQKNKGFGFGLMNCKGIIGKYKKTNAVFNVCEFGVESEKGKGSRFFFRLPKGMLKTVVGVLLLLIGFSPAEAKDNQVTTASHYMAMARQYSDSIFSANVNGNYEKAIVYADSTISYLNLHCLSLHPENKYLMALEGHTMAEIEWWRLGYETDYEMIIGVRNEVTIAALALNRNDLYHYNSEAFTRLYKISSTDPTLEEYCNDIRVANRNKKTIIILLGILIVLVIAAYFFVYYRTNQLFIFNLRQFIQLNNKVFSSREKNLLEVLRQNLSDIKTTDMIGMMLPSQVSSDQFQYQFTGNVAERATFESMMQAAYRQKKSVVSNNVRFRSYPMFMPGVEETTPIGVLGIRFIDGKLLEEESLIVNLVVQFMSIHTYFSNYKVDEMSELLELKNDERTRIDNEQQKVYVRNQIMDNCLSTLKHETMYYPNRIKQIVDATLEKSTFSASEPAIRDIDELLSYYKEVFTILSTCAGKQVEKVLFKRASMSLMDIEEMIRRSFKKQARKALVKSSIQVAHVPTVNLQVDKIFLQTLIDNILSLFFEHQSGGDLLVDFEISDGFAKFAFTDTAYQYPEECIPHLFYIDNMKYDSKTDTLSGSQYMICRQVVREHDAYSSRRGCRIYVENKEQGSSFIFTLPVQ